MEAEAGAAGDEAGDSVGFALTGVTGAEGPRAHAVATIRTSAPKAGLMRV